MSNVIKQQETKLVAQLILRDKLKVMLGNYPSITYANVVVGALTLMVLSHLIAMEELIIWFSCILVIAFSRLWLHKLYYSLIDNSIDNSIDKLSKYSRIFIVTTFIASLPWCYAAWFFILETEPEYITYLMVVLIGMAAGAIGSNSGYFPTFISYAIPFLSLLAIRVWIIDSFNYQILGFLVMSLTVGFISFARANQKSVEQGLRLKYENLSLVSQLEEKNHSLSDQVAKVKEANRQKSQFLAASSHDLRQPLQSLSLFNEVLQTKLTDKSCLPIMAKINLSISALNSLFTTLLDVSRLDAGDVKVHVSTASLGEIIDKLATRYQDQALAKGIIIKTLPTSLLVKTDVILLQRCLSNLLVNAIVHSHASRVLIGVKRRGKCVEVYIIDNGNGIAVDEQSVIFQEFHQLNNPARDRNKGLGLGLAIVKRTTDLLQHRLNLTSTINKGSAFSIKLPRDYTVVDTKKITTLPSWNLTGKIILVIDDECDIREGMALLLKGWSAEVITADSENEAISLIEAGFCPDIIISDYRLPGRATGADLVKKIRAESGTDIPAMLITGDTAPERIKEARSSGLLLLHKPVSAAKLRMAINKVISKKLC